jgi:membrane protein DedA with SNARE-associated domain
MDALTAELAQHGVRIVFSNVLLQQVGIPIPAEPTLVIAGSLAARQVLSGSAVGLAALAAIVVADVTWFVLGRWFGRRVLGFVSRLIRAPEARMSETERAFARWGLKSLIVAKFLPGVSQLLLPMAGAMGAKLRTVLFYDLLGGVIWTSATIGGGMFFHHQVESLLATPPRVAIWALAGAGVAGAAFIVWLWRRRHHPAVALTAAPTSEQAHGAG